MEDEIYKIISSWAGIPTWYTNHSLDQNRFSEAMVNLISEFGTNLDIESFERALRKHAENTPTMLGEPDNWDSVIFDFVVKAETIKNYESVR